MTNLEATFSNFFGRLSLENPISKIILDATTGLTNRKGLQEISVHGIDKIDGVSAHIYPLMVEYLKDVEDRICLFDINYYLALLFHDVIEDGSSSLVPQAKANVINSLKELQNFKSPFNCQDPNMTKVLAIITLCSKDPKRIDKHKTSDRKNESMTEAVGITIDRARILFGIDKESISKKNNPADDDTADSALLNSFRFVMDSDGTLNQEAIAGLPILLVNRLLAHGFISLEEKDKYIEDFRTLFYDPQESEEIVRTARKIKLRDRNQSLNQDLYVVDERLHEENYLKSSEPSVSEGAEYADKTGMLLEAMYGVNPPHLDRVINGQCDLEEVLLYDRLCLTIDTVKLQEEELIKGIIGGLEFSEISLIHADGVYANIKDCVLEEGDSHEWRVISMLHDIVEHTLEEIPVLYEGCLRKKLMEKYPRLFTKARMDSVVVTFAISVIVSSHLYELESKRWLRQLKDATSESKIEENNHLTRLFPKNYVSSDYFVSIIKNFLHYYILLKTGVSSKEKITVSLEEFEDFKKFIESLEPSKKNNMGKLQILEKWLMSISDDNMSQVNPPNKLLKIFKIPLGRKSRVEQLVGRFAYYAEQRYGSKSEKRNFLNFIQGLCINEEIEMSDFDKYNQGLKGIELPLDDLDRLVAFMENHDIEGLVLKAAEVLDIIKNPRKSGGALTSWRYIQDLVSFYAPMLRLAGYKKMANKCYDIAYQYIYLSGFAEEASHEDLNRKLKGKYDLAEQLLIEQTSSEIVGKMQVLISNAVGVFKPNIKQYVGMDTRVPRVKSVGSMAKKLCRDGYKDNTDSIELPDNIGYGYSLPDEVFDDFERDQIEKLAYNIATEVLNQGLLGHISKVKLYHPLQNNTPIEIKSTRFGKIEISGDGSPNYKSLRNSGHTYQSISITFQIQTPDEQTIGLEIQLLPQSFTIVKRLDDLAYKANIGALGHTPIPPKKLKKLNSRVARISERRWKSLQRDTSRRILYINMSLSYRRLLKLLGFDPDATNVYGERYFNFYQEP